MKTNKFLSWLKTWDAGEFDFTAALHDRQAELNVNEGNRDHPWKLEPVNRLEAGEIRSFRKLYPAFAVILCCILIGFLQYVRTFADRVSQISEQFNALMMALAGAERIFGILDLPPEEDQGQVTLEQKGDDYHWRMPDGTLVPLRGDVRFSHVDFAYVPEKPVLRDLSLYAKPGQKIAFVGATGAGKTTITNLINRFYDIADGKIRYDNININKIRKPDLRRSLGIVLQDTNLFTGTVMDNIRYGKLDATDEECIHAAKLANAHDFITRLPDGYNTMLTGNGASLSQGQRQLIAIARAAVADPPVMILDEATSSIDTRTEKLVQDGMDALMKGRTTFVIAHRLSTIKRADQIMCICNKGIAERGTHEELMQKKGIYYELNMSQYRALIQQQ